MVAVVLEASCYRDVDEGKDEEVDVRCKENFEIFFPYSSLILNSISVVGCGPCSSNPAASMCKLGPPGREHCGITDTEHVHGAGGRHAGRSHSGELQM